MLDLKFKSLLNKYSNSSEFINQCWNEIVDAYSQTSRHYHNLKHLENMMHEFDTVGSCITNLDAVQFAIFYHDIFYDASRSDNEYQSALFFEEKISQTNFLEIKETMNLIEATDRHMKNSDKDTNLFLDIDLSILGQSEETYRSYSRQIRREYQIYKDSIYYEGRKKVLEHFLAAHSIFHTQYFSNKYEKQARKNLQAELLTLS